MSLDLTNKDVIIPLLRQHHLYTQKEYGQHFLIDQSALNKIIHTANIQPTDTIIEIGAGIGVLTQELAKRAGHVISFEIDTTLQPVLHQTVGEYTNLQLIFQDFLKTNLDEVLDSQPAPIQSGFSVLNQTTDRRQEDSLFTSANAAATAKLAEIKSESSCPTTTLDDNEKSTPSMTLNRDSSASLQNDATNPDTRIPTPKTLPFYKLVANLPYNAGSHILDVFIKSPNPPQSITVLLQKEVAQKITATPPHATYLSNFFQLYGSAEIVQIVPPTSFFPPPKVDSALLHVNRSTGYEVRVADSSRNSELEPLDPATYSRFLHRGFAQPRKMLNKVFSKEELSQANIDSSSRPENLTFDQWRELFKVINY